MNRLGQRLATEHEPGVAVAEDDVVGAQANDACETLAVEQHQQAGDPVGGGDRAVMQQAPCDPAAGVLLGGTLPGLRIWLVRQC